MISKWILFYSYIFYESKGGWNWERVRTIDAILYTVWMIASLPVIEMIIMVVPLHLAIRQQRRAVKFMILILCFAVEFFVSFYATNEQLSEWMIIKIILSVVIFWLFYRRLL